ncbi:MAG: hypothetical protein PHR16_12385 [Methylovulum sp.]|nr:hypothetical protein [Methylovulum sp.]
MFTTIPKKPSYHLTALLLFVFNSASFAGETTRVSVSSDGQQENANSYSVPSISAVSADGRFVAFYSFASNLVAGDTNDTVDIFVHDRLTRQTTRVSVASDGQQGNGDSFNPSISADGRFVAFNSNASDLVAGDTNDTMDIFVHDRLTRQTTRVSVASDGQQGNGGSFHPSISADGRFVVFNSGANRLVAGDTNDAYDIFVHDRLTRQTTRASVSSHGKQGNTGSYGPSGPSISADGRFVAFVSDASDLVAGDTNDTLDIFVHDRLTRQTTRVSVASNGQQGNKASFNSPSISADGRFVAFDSYASNLVAGDTNDAFDIFVHDRLTRQTTLASVTSDGHQGSSDSYNPSISADGRFVAFFSYASDLVAGDKNGTSDVFIHDRLTRQNTLASVTSDGQQGHGASYYPTVSADGHFVTFGSDASNLVGGDTNQSPDIFIRDRKLLKTNQTDLQIAATQQPTSLVRNSEGTYQYTITNNGPDVVKSVRIVHSVSNGRVARFHPDQGKCRRYATVSLCELGNLLPGNSMKLEVIVKALHHPLSQQISVSPNAIKDTVPDNNSISIETPVTP